MGFWVWLVLVAPFSLVEGWLLMLLVGMVRHNWLPMVPTIGYWDAVPIAAVASVLFGLMRFDPSKYIES